MTGLNRFGSLTLFAVLGLTAAGAQPVLGSQQPKPDNTKVNAADREPSSVTADQQRNERSDLQTTRDIRKAIVADKSLSTYAHNVKIVTQQGTVTLKGPVRTDAEKSTIETKAAEVAGAAHVVNQIAVVPATSGKSK